MSHPWSRISSNQLNGDNCFKPCCLQIDLSSVDSHGTQLFWLLVDIFRLYSRQPLLEFSGSVNLQNAAGAHLQSFGSPNFRVRSNTTSSCPAAAAAATAVRHPPPAGASARDSSRGHAPLPRHQRQSAHPLGILLWLDGRRWIGWNRLAATGVATPAWDMGAVKHERAVGLGRWRRGRGVGVRDGSEPAGA